MSKLVAQAREALQRGQFNPALEAIAQCEEKGPLALQHYMIRGLAQIGLANWPAAIETFRVATKRWRDNHELWAYCGLALQNIRQPEEKWEAVDCFERALQLNPDNGIAAANLANLYRRIGRFKEGEALAQIGVKHHPDKVWAMNILGLLTREMGHYEKAREIYKEALRLEPNAPNVIYNLANIEVDLENFSAAWPLYKRAQALTPRSKMRMGESWGHLLSGNYVKGWELNVARREERNESMDVGNVPGQSYRGQPLQGKRLTIVAEQGFGDQLMFCRFAPEMVEKGAELSWILPKPLIRLFEANFPGKFYALNDPRPDGDYYVPICSLPHYVESGRSPDTIPKKPYLVAPDGPKLPETGREGPKVGLIWAGAPGNERDFHRSMPSLAPLAPLFQEVKAQFYAPFLSDKLDQIKDEPIMRLDHLIKDFGDTAALMQQMDYIVGVETGAAHLAGALGKKMFVLLGCLPDWRWGYRGEESLWYPTSTLLRQDTPGDWASAVRKLVMRLKNK
jgi:tetratricopeptide (TPR) repeat protein